MTDPIVPAEVDLRGYEFMPFYGHHLFGSDFNSRVSDAGWRAAVTLWWAAWNQVPAASLPNNEAALCRLADLGRDLKAWRKVKADALHGFIECSDGRIYHKALAVWALEAWAKREDHKAGKARLERHRAERRDLFELLRQHGEVPSFETPIATLREMAAKHSRHVAGNVSSNGLATAREGQDRTAKGERSESDTSNRDVGVTATIPGNPQADATGQVAVGKALKVNGAGQNWKSDAYVVATANTLGIDRRIGESFDEFKDRVYTAVQHKRTEATRAA
jgi:hypothetical protein